MSARVLLLSVMCLLGLAGALASVPRLDSSLAAMLFLLGALLVAPAFLAATRRAFDPVESIHLWSVTYGYAYLVKPVARLVGGEEWLLGEEHLTWAIGVSVMGLLAFYAGYCCRLGPAVARHLPAMSRDVSPRRLRACGWAFIGVGATGLWAYMDASGGWREFWSLPHGHGGRAEGTTAYIYQLPELMIVGFFLIAYDAIRESRLSPRVVTRLAVASAGGIGIYTLLWSRRTLIAWALIALFVMLALRREEKPRLLKMALWGTLLYVATSLALAYRPHLHLGAGWEDLGDADIGRAARRTVTETGDEFDSFLAIVTLYPRAIDYDYFRVYGQSLLHPIPRLVWPEKPPLFVTSWEDFLEASRIGAGASEGILGDLYIQLGPWGVAVGMVVVGVLWRLLFAYLRRAPTSGLMPVLYAVAVGNVPSLVLQSGVAALWKWLPFMVPGVVVAYWIARERPRAAVEARLPVGAIRG